jgi:hypothetical protein
MTLPNIGGIPKFGMNSIPNGRDGVRPDRAEAVGWSGNVRYAPDSDLIISSPRNDVMGHQETALWRMLYFSVTS